MTMQEYLHIACLSSLLGGTRLNLSEIVNYLSAIIISLSELCFCGEVVDGTWTAGGLSNCSREFPSFTGVTS